MTIIIHIVIHKQFIIMEVCRAYKPLSGPPHMPRGGGAVTTELDVEPEPQAALEDPHGIHRGGGGRAAAPECAKVNEKGLH